MNQRIGMALGIIGVCGFWLWLALLAHYWSGFGLPLLYMVGIVVFGFGIPAAIWQAFRHKPAPIDD